MDTDIFIPFIPISAFFATAYAIKAVVDARVRGKLIAANCSQELVRALLLSDEENRRMGALRWGVVLTCLAGGLGLIEAFGWDEPTAGVFAVLVGATGVGYLAFFAIAQFTGLRSPGDRGSQL